MRIALVLVVVVAACGDSTDIAGTYVGNATLTTSAGAVVAEPATVVVQDSSDDNVDVFIGSACELSATELKQVAIKDHSGYSNFVLTTESLSPAQLCELGADAITLVEGDLVADAGGTLTVELGGYAGSGSDYAVYRFDGALR